MVDLFIGSREEYEAKAGIHDVVEKIAGLQSEVGVNCRDKGENIYLTVTGTSIEMGDDGATGRGNRGNGLVFPHASMTMEAIAGKNPLSHEGKIYNVPAQRSPLFRQH